MLDSERTFKIMVRLQWTVFEILLMSAIIYIWRVLPENEIAQYLQNYKRHDFDQGYSTELL